MSVRLERAQSLGWWAECLGGELDEGAGDSVVERVAEPGPCDAPNTLQVLLRARYAPGEISAASVWLCTPELAGRLPTGRRLSHGHAAWALARLLAGAAPAAAGRVHPSARVAATAVVEPGVGVGEDARIEAGAVIYAGVTLGARVRIGAGAVIGRPGFGWVEGPDGQRERMPQPGGVVLEDDVEVGPLCTVDSGTLAPTLLQRGVKLDAHVHVGHNVRIGPDCLIAAQVGFAGSVVLGRGVLVGGQAGFKDHVRVGDGARVLAKSGVIGDVPPGAIVAGFPAMARVPWLRAMAELRANRGRRR
ncbi:MAG: UDP-3-O-(3-hydroxymyristoyl)glucosamine N-acyltransferase [Polyangiaceae bacterium]|nr:UDP-3-O-(3-hydroxymyristoyl)glucosamine N-acyltransferase [Polyangiaceae bacterium]